jgi:hypothetical protein
MRRREKHGQINGHSSEVEGREEGRGQWSIPYPCGGRDCGGVHRVGGKPPSVLQRTRPDVTDTRQKFGGRRSGLGRRRGRPPAGAGRRGAALLARRGSRRNGLGGEEPPRRPPSPVIEQRRARPSRQSNEPGGVYAAREMDGCDSASLGGHGPVPSTRIAGTTLANAQPRGRGTRAGACGLNWPVPPLGLTVQSPNPVDRYTLYEYSKHNMGILYCLPLSTVVYRISEPILLSSRECSKTTHSAIPTSLLLDRPSYTQANILSDYQYLQYRTLVINTIFSLDIQKITDPRKRISAPVYSYRREDRLLHILLTSRRAAVHHRRFAFSLLPQSPRRSTTHKFTQNKLQ